MRLTISDGKKLQSLIIQNYYFIHVAMCLYCTGHEISHVAGQVAKSNHS